jgi:hypothetical protein
MKPSRNGAATDHGTDRVQWIKQYRASGMGLKQFAQRHGLRPSQLHYWVYQTSPCPTRLAAVPTFQEVRLAGPARSEGSWSAEIGLPNGTTVRLTRETDAAWAMALIDSLRRPCSP